MIQRRMTAKVVVFGRSIIESNPVVVIIVVVAVVLIVLAIDVAVAVL